MVAALAVVTGRAGQGRAAAPAAATPRASAPTVAGTPMANIADVYAWMADPYLNLIMDVSPRDDGAQAFGPSVVYAFHLTSKAGRGVLGTDGTETRVICRFDSNTSVACWVVSGDATEDYVAGDPSAAAGVASKSAQLRVFAGRRSDPRFASQTAFDTAAATFNGLVSVAGATRDGAQCPNNLMAGDVQTLRNQLTGGVDDYAQANVMALVVQIDKSLVNAGTNTTVAVWASTHAGA
jgi:hypothetical protein